VLLRHVHISARLEADTWRGILPLLSADERGRLHRLRFARDQWSYLAAHALVRTTLSAAYDIHPTSWVFRRGRHSRPEIVGHGNLPLLGFSLSHTDGLAVCAVSRHRDIGVDAEAVDHLVTGDQLDRYFSPDEARDLEGRRGKDWRERFFRYWTLKEAYVKARGVGLSLPLDRFSFELHGDDVAIIFAARADDKPLWWQFHLSSPTARHVVALAMRRPPNRVVRIESRAVGLEELSAP